ncbi:unnamed protein product [Rangifer tarandus platyrhynchus]|uniref:Uncharacterized protein n=1 Tax=Rangifer tarandus platyrhynchus TaxID=3082113 RepID=A0AC59YLW1_RANTA
MGPHLCAPTPVLTAGARPAPCSHCPPPPGPPHFLLPPETILLDISFTLPRTPIPPGGAVPSAMRSDLKYAYFSVLSCCLLVASKKPEETVLRPPAWPRLERATPRPEQAPPMSRPRP